MAKQSIADGIGEGLAGGTVGYMKGGTEGAVAGGVSGIVSGTVTGLISGGLSYKAQGLQQKIINKFKDGKVDADINIDTKGVSKADKLKISSWKYAPDEELYLKYKDVFDNPKYYNQTTGEINWPGQYGDPNIDGFLNGEFEVISLKAGQKIDRYGGNNGSFFADEGIPTENRAMAPSSDFSSYNVYEIKREIPMRRGDIAPWFDEIGGGIQYQVDPIFEKEIRNKLNRGENFIDGLIRLGYLKRL